MINGVEQSRAALSEFRVFAMVATLRDAHNALDVFQHILDGEIPEAGRVLRRFYPGEAIILNGTINKGSEKRYWVIERKKDEGDITAVGQVYVGRPRCAVVQIGEDTYFAFKGLGAFKNGERLNGNTAEIEKLSKNENFSSFYPLFSEAKQ